ncbi:MAG: epoxyqueuosine reductase QueH [Patescibacteria group bacterium]|nr:epoxyqueuosine reductase QueH [Patescibacteria group bacterium]
MGKLVKFYLALCWAFVIFILLTTPLPAVSEPQEKINVFDKGVHFILFGVLTWLIIRAGLEFAKKSNFKISAIAAFVFSFIYAVFCEYVQVFVPGRDLSEFDLAFGALGMIAAIFVYFYFLRKTKPKLFLHVCCAGCGAYAAQTLKKDYRLVLYFYNPNIYPKSEYEKRLAEAKKIAAEYGLKIIFEKYDHASWLEKIKGHEKDLERGERCRICYQDRLEKTAKIAREKRFALFTTTLTISPHKDAGIISRLGRDLENKYKVKFLDKDFKKQDGFKKSAFLARKLGLYRQNYCGCEFSQKG